MDLRSEVGEVEWLDAFKGDWTSVELSDADRALMTFAEALTRTPGAVGRADADALRAAGFDDRAIHDAAQVVGYFNYINRVADALGTDPEPEFGTPPGAGGTA